MAPPRNVVIGQFVRRIQLWAGTRNWVVNLKRQSRYKIRTPILICSAVQTLATHFCKCTIVALQIVGLSRYTWSFEHFRFNCVHTYACVHALAAQRYVLYFYYAFVNKNMNERES